MTDNRAFSTKEEEAYHGVFQDPPPSVKVANGSDWKSGGRIDSHYDLDVEKNLDDKDSFEEEATCKDKVFSVLNTLSKAVAITACLYFFICSLNMLSSGFILVGGRLAGDAFKDNPLLSNPICGLMLGVVSTAFLQSSSTSTSIVVTLVAADIVPVQQGIPIVMGANIGTSVTGILVATTQAGNREQFKKAFTAATVHDMFNWLTVITLLPIEQATGYLYRMTSAIVNHSGSSGGHSKQEFLSVITKPFTNLIVQVDKKALEIIAAKEDGWETIPLLKEWCKYTTEVVNSTDANSTEPDYGNTTQLPTPAPTTKIGLTKCKYLFANSGLSEQAVGGLVVLISLVMLICCLIVMVKVLKSILEGPMAKVIQKTINADFPGKCAYFTGYVAILVGAIATVLVQSSSVVTSGLTPLVGLGMVTVERVYPMLLGANIGTTSTAILAAFAASSTRFQTTFQIALCHLFFNLSGIIIWYPIPFMRKAPIGLATFLGKTTARYRWFAILYLLCMFLVFPMTIFALSIPGWWLLAAVGIPIILLVIFIAIINILQNKKPQALPEKMRTWDFLPEPLRSLEPMDRQVSKLIRCCSCCKCCAKLNEASHNHDDDVVNHKGEVIMDQNGKQNYAYDDSWDTGVQCVNPAGSTDGGQETRL